MPTRRLLFALLALLACGLIATGCGDDDDDTTTSDAAETTTEETTTTEDDSDSGDSDSGGDSADAGATDVYDACIAAIEGTAAEEAGQSACQQAEDAFVQCSEQAEALPEDNNARETAIKTCQDAADQAVDALNAAGG